MVLLQFAEDGVKNIKQNVCDKNTGMTQPFSAWNGQYEIRNIIPYVHLRTKCLTKRINHRRALETNTR